jgi:hypothetical protein
MDLIELPTPPDRDDATCAGCGAPLAPDQRYCLACGRPCSPVRLAFLDALQAERQPAAAYAVGGGVGPPGYPAHPAAQEPDGMLGSLRRYSGLLALLGVLLGCLLIGLLVGHWVSPSSTPTGPQVVRIEGLTGPLASAAAPAAAASTAPTASTTAAPAPTSTATPAAASGSPKAEEAEESKEVKDVKPPPPVTKKTSSTTLQKLDKTTGKQHAQEVNAQLGDGPIETGH